MIQIVYFKWFTVSWKCVRNENPFIRSLNSLLHNQWGRREEEEEARGGDRGQSCHRGLWGGPEGEGQEVGVLLRLHRDLRAQGAPKGRRNIRPHLGLQEQGGHTYIRSLFFKVCNDHDHSFMTIVLLDNTPWSTKHNWWFWAVVLGGNSIDFKNVTKILIKILTKIITNLLSKSYNKKSRNLKK